MNNNLTILKAIQKCTREVLLPVQGTGLDWQITKNLHKLDRYLEQLKDQYLALEAKFYKINAAGEVIYYAITPKGDGLGTFDKDGNGNRIEVPVDYRGHKAPAVDEFNPDYTKALEDFNNEINFDFHVLDETKIKEAYESGKFSGLDLTPLIGTLIIIDNENN